jgi:hypothetical protein
MLKQIRASPILSTGEYPTWNQERERSKKRFESMVPKKKLQVVFLRGEKSPWLVSQAKEE